MVFLPPPTPKVSAVRGVAVGLNSVWAEFRCPVNLTVLPWGRSGAAQRKKASVGRTVWM